MILSADTKQISEYLKHEIASSIKLTPDSIAEDVNFLKYGISSIQTIMIINKIKKKLEINLNPVAMFEYKNISELASYIAACMEDDIKYQG